MNRCVFILLAFLSLNQSISQIEALNRDYVPRNYSTIFHSWCGEDESFYSDESYYFCIEDCLDQLWNEPAIEDHFLLYTFPESGPDCTCCGSPSMYLGYVDPDFKKYIKHLQTQLDYAHKHADCLCLWPEQSKKAAQISDTAYILFRDLISSTALSSLLKSEKDQKKFFDSYSFLNKHEIIISFIVQQFRFSDFYHVCQEIENFSISKYEEKEAAKIKDKLEDILETLYDKFFTLYSSCYANHPNVDIDQEIRFMKLLVNDISGFENTLSSSTVPSDLKKIQNSIVANLQISSIISDINDKNIIDDKSFCVGIPPQIYLASTTSDSDEKFNIVFSSQSQIFLEQGTLLNSLLLYNEAIQALTQAIQLNSANRDAYIERATAYFETNQLSLALQDYEMAKKLMIVPLLKLDDIKASSKVAIYVPKNKMKFSKGLVSGIADGAQLSVKEFVPSLFSCCRGILHGLWAFACSPKEVSQEMVNAAYAMGEFISSHSTEECFQCLVPELKELSLSWDKIDDYDRGLKIGFIIGKYGVDIFAPIGGLKAVNKVRALKRANTMYTLESCASSQVKQIKILEESTKRAVLRENIINEYAKKGKILTKTSNVQYHVMQPKHGWDKLLKLSGNIEEDFKKVLTFLKNKNIMKSENLKSTVLFPRNAAVKNVHLLEYKAIVDGYEIQVFFEKYLDSGEVFLKNAWVITK